MKIGLEIHVALPTRSKLFCSCSANGEEPNTAVCPICMGFPGSKPMLNKEAVSNALSIARALNCEINNKISFVRKVYFYPDLPKSYQITQTEGAVGNNGHLGVEDKKVRIRRVQLEEDPAKLVRDGVQTLIDFNRSGIPLVEIVTEPDMHSEPEVWAFLRKLRSILYYLKVDIDKEIKADLNISLADVRVETKNITGIKNIIDATKYEINRQSELLKKNQPIARETRAYNEKKRATISMREKETDEEYGYIYEPDLGTFEIGEIRYTEATYADETAEKIAEKHGVRARTIKELVMFDTKSLEKINKYKDSYPMQNIINAIERIKKYGKEGISDQMFKEVLELIGKDVIVTREVLQQIEKGKVVERSSKKISDAEMDKIVKDYLEKNPELVPAYKKNSRVANLVIDAISKKNNLHPKEVARRAIPIIQKLAHT